MYNFLAVTLSAALKKKNAFVLSLCHFIRYEGGVLNSVSILHKIGFILCIQSFLKVHAQDLRFFFNIGIVARSLHIPYTKMLVYNSDNCNTMKGKNNSLLTRLQSVQPALVDMGCICHLVNLATGSGVKQLPVSPDDLLVDIFYHFHHRWV